MPGSAIVALLAVHLVGMSVWLLRYRSPSRTTVRRRPVWKSIVMEIAWAQLWFVTMPLILFVKRMPQKMIANRDGAGRGGVETDRKPSATL